LNESNCTGRLALILDAARKQPNNITISQAWANILEIPKTDSARLFEGIAELVKLSVSAKKEVENNELLQAPVYKKPFVKVEKVFSNLNLNTSWNSVSPLIDEGTVDMLKACSGFIEHNSSSKSMTFTELEQLRIKLDEIVLLISESSLPDELKLFFIRNLDALRTSLTLFKIKGSEGINEEIQRIYGAIWLNNSKIDNELQKADGSKQKSDWEGLLTKVNGFLLQANNITTEVQKLNNTCGGAVAAIFGS